MIGNDRDNDLWGMSGDDVVTGGGGNDFLNSGAGDDEIDGGEGLDIVEQVSAYGGPRLGDDTFAESGVVTDPATGTSTGGADVGTDTLTGIEGAFGTLGNDTLTGNDDNEFFDLEGDDTIDLGGPGEPQEGGVQDLALPGGGDDTVMGSNGFDAVDYYPSPPVLPHPG